MTNEEFIESIRLEGEEWRDIVGYEETYMVSSYGRAMSKYRHVRNRYGIKEVQPRLLNPHHSRVTNNYVKLELKLWKGSVGKTVLLHRTIAQVFIPNPLNLKEIDHIDGNTLNNAISNLRWCTHAQNTRNPITRKRSSAAKRGKFNTPTSKAVVQLEHNSLVNVFPSISEAGRQGFSRSKISMCCSHKRAHHRSYRWMYLSDYETLVSKSKNSTNPEIG